MMFKFIRKLFSDKHDWKYFVSVRDHYTVYADLYYCDNTKERKAVYYDAMGRSGKDSRRLMFLQPDLYYNTMLWLNKMEVKCSYPLSMNDLDEKRGCQIFEGGNVVKFPSGKN